MDLFKELGDALRPQESQDILDLKSKIENLNEKKFHSIGSGTYVDLQADDESETYLIEDVYSGDLQDEFYEADTHEHIKENNEWQYENSFIKQYFLNHLQLIQIINE